MSRAWRWARGVIADRGEQEPVPIFLERAAGGGYSFRLGLRAGIDGGSVAHIPVHRRINPDPHPLLKEIHRCEVAGRVLEAGNIHALRDKVAALLDALAPSRSLPLAYFRAPALDCAVPVFAEDGRIVSPGIGGPRLRAGDLAGIRRELCRQLAEAGCSDDPDEMALGVLRPSDLRLVPPAAVVRSLADPALWIPAVDGSSGGEPVIGTLGHAADGDARAATRAPAAPDLLSLIGLLRAELREEHAPGDPAELYASEVRKSAWAAAARRTEPAGIRLVAGLDDPERTRLELAPRRTGAGELAVALEEERINVFLSESEGALAHQVGAHLAAGGFLRHPDELEIQPTNQGGSARMPVAISAGGPS